MRNVVTRQKTANPIQNFCSTDIEANGRPTTSSSHSNHLESGDLRSLALFPILSELSGRDLSLAKYLAYLRDHRSQGFAFDS